MTATIARSRRPAPTVATLQETHPTPCPVVQGVRRAYAHWFYDLSDGYILYYLPGFGQRYEHRLVAECVIAPTTEPRTCASSVVANTAWPSLAMSQLRLTPAPPVVTPSKPCASV
jgi:hypothetical protein